MQKNLVTLDYTIVHLLLLFLLISFELDARSASLSIKRHQNIDAIVLHAIGGPFCKNNKLHYSPAKGGVDQWLYFFNNHPVLGIHYIVGRDGEVKSQIPVDKVANHTLGWNQNSVGIELVNDGDHQETYSELQMDALKKLITSLQDKYPTITNDRIYRHSDLDSRTIKCAGRLIKRKQDPGALFEYDALLDSLNR